MRARDVLGGIITTHAPTQSKELQHTKRFGRITTSTGILE